MVGRLNGKRVLLTAAGQGIGRASALAMAEEGARVVATDINEETLEALSSDGVSIDCRKLDVLDQTAISTLVGELGAVDVLFNCAGYVHNGTILDCNNDEWEFAFNLNAKARYHMIRAFLPAMLQASGGSIFNMSSLASSM